MMNFAQVSTVLNQIYQTASGRQAPAVTDLSSFVSVANTTLALGNDKVIDAICDVITRTIFSIRPYRNKLDFLFKPESQWGAFVRKLSVVDSDFKDDDAYKWPVLYDSTQTPPTGNGEFVNQWKINKRDVLQTFFAGSIVYADHYTLFDKQFNTAFRGPEELANFFEMLVMNSNNKLELARENVIRGLILNMIGSVLAENQTGRVIHLLTEYNAATGLTLTAQTALQPDNFIPFMQWVYARITEVSTLMESASNMYQTEITGKPVLRHTPKDRQRLIMHSQTEAQITSMIRTNIRNNSYLAMPIENIRFVPYWQSIRDGQRMAINVTPTYTGTNGTTVTPASAVTNGAVLGIMFDEEAAGAAELDGRVLATRLNEAGLYRNIFTHALHKLAMDNTEKIVVFCMD